MPLALYVRAGKAVWRGEIPRADLLWQFLRIFSLSSISIAIVAILTRFVKGLFG